ncbi:MAG: ketoacyl-ACP synthase III [Phycisphaerales bacterium]|nr:ketoacyl-ACP synthase III [Phycisphaerales bacterium]
MTRPNGSFGVDIIGSGSGLPDTRLTNADLEKVMDTSDEWITKRTGIKERRKADIANGELSSTLAIKALNAALEDAGITKDDLDMILVATMTPDMPTPSVACVVARKIGAGNIAAIDINGACSGFIYTISMANAMIQAGPYKTIAVIGADTLTRYVDYSTEGRTSAILFGDAAAALILRRNDDTSRGLIAHRMHTDGEGSKHLYIPSSEFDIPEDSEYRVEMCNRVQMNGQAVFKFAVSKFQQVIGDTLADAGLTADDVDHFVCHQANSRILDSARDRFGIPSEKLLINIDRYGNTVAASAPLVFTELAKSGRIKPGNKVMFLAFGAGLTWGSSLWQL